jgi:3-methyladenine DNA glycosylase AlkD
MLLREELFELVDLKYRTFQQRLLPGIEGILGVRIPELRKIGRRIVKGNVQEYLLNSPNEYFEEIMLKGIVIGYAKESFHEKLKQIEEFLPLINNWCVCDVFVGGLKDIAFHKEEMWICLSKNLNSQEEYRVRFGVVVLLNYYKQQQYIDSIFKFFNQIQSEKYYVNMSIAWAISMMYIDFKAETLKFLKENRLNTFTYNKSLQKIIESRQISFEEKEMIREMKRKV